METALTRRSYGDVVNKQQGDKASGKIIIVEDDASQLRVMAAALRNAGYDVREYGNGSDGDAGIRELRPDLVILDIMLPEKSGLDICSDMRNDTALKDIPAILITVLTEDSPHDDEYWRNKAGSNEFITKPFPIGDLVWRVAKLISAGKTLDDRIK